MRYVLSLPLLHTPFGCASVLLLLSAQHSVPVPRIFPYQSSLALSLRLSYSRGSLVWFCVIDIVSFMYLSSLCLIVVEPLKPTVKLRLCATQPRGLRGRSAFFVIVSRLRSPWNLPCAPREHAPRPSLRHICAFLHLLPIRVLTCGNRGRKVNQESPLATSRERRLSDCQCESADNGYLSHLVQRVHYLYNLIDRSSILHIHVVVWRQAPPTFSGEKLFVDLNRSSGD